MALVSPGVQVTVIDESFYTPAGAGTVPIIFIATAQDKVSASGSGTAIGTLQANAGKPYLITSQRELGETFGDATFYSDAIGNMIHGGELNEYGLNTAYSVLGVSNRAYVVRADLDLSKLEASATAPGGEPADGAYWLDTNVTAFGALEWNGAALTAAGGQSFNTVTPIAISDVTNLATTIEGKQNRHGFENQTDSTLSFVDGTRTFTITGTFKIFNNGVLVNKTTESVTIANTIGLWFIYYHATTNAITSNTLTTITKTYEWFNIVQQ